MHHSEQNGGARTRREFLKATTQATMAVTGLAATVGKEEAHARGRLLLGRGEHTYECIHDWLKPPPHIKWGDTQGIAEDSRGNIYIAHTVHPSSPSSDAIVVFDRFGKFVTSWGARFRGGAHGLDLRREGREEYLYHCDTTRRQFAKTKLNGEVVWEKGLPPEAAELYADNKTFIPTNIAFSPNGDFYVTDGYGSDWIHQFRLDGEYIRTFGGKGKEPGKVLQAHGIWVDTRGKEPFLVVADRANNRLQYFTLDGQHVKFVTEGMRLPCHFHLRGDLMLIPDLDSVVTLLDSKNRVVVKLGDGAPSKLRGAPRDQWLPGKFIHPHDAQFIGKHGDILVAEWVPTGRITRLKKVG